MTWFRPALGLTALLLVSVVPAGCSPSTMAPRGGDGGADTGSPDAGPVRPDTGPMDGGPSDVDAGAPVDAGPDGGAVDRCAPLAAAGHEVCAGSSSSCEVVFRDGAGCAAVCAAAGLTCGASHEDVDGLCAADLDRAELGCADTGHMSDHCLCVTPDCVPSCGASACGTDGCGGSCGTCDVTGESCVAGQCEAEVGDRPWESLLDDIVGYATGTTGGAGGSVCWVENRSNSGTGSLRACVETPGAVWIRFNLGGTFALDSALSLHSDTTIDGRGHDVQISRYGLVMSDVDNIVLHNLTVRDGVGGDSDDAIRITSGAHHIWVDHVSLADFPDGLLDVTRQATDVTISWSRFSDHDKTMLIGASPDHTGDTVIRVTLHHSYFDRTNQRHPRLRYGRVHSFNNYFREWGSYASASSQDGELLSEANIYLAGSDPDALRTRAGSDPRQGDIRSTGDSFRNGAVRIERNASSVFTPPYPHSADTANDALRDAVRDGAGRQDL